MLIKNLQPIYHGMLFYQSIFTFEELFEVGTRIEDAIGEGKFRKDEPSHQSKRPNFTRNLTYVNVLTT